MVLRDQMGQQNRFSLFQIRILPEKHPNTLSQIGFFPARQKHPPAGLIRFLSPGWTKMQNTVPEGAATFAKLERLNQQGAHRILRTHNVDRHKIVAESPETALLIWSIITKNNLAWKGLQHGHTHNLPPIWTRWNAQDLLKTLNTQKDTA